MKTSLSSCGLGREPCAPVTSSWRRRGFKSQGPSQRGHFRGETSVQSPSRAFVPGRTRRLPLSGWRAQELKEAQPARSRSGAGQCLTVRSPAREEAPHRYSPGRSPPPPHRLRCSRCVPELPNSPGFGDKRRASREVWTSGPALRKRTNSQRRHAPGSPEFPFPPAPHLSPAWPGVRTLLAVPRPPAGVLQPTPP